jgi:ribonucleotide reductase beta subunit family protein with ferritin-like domain
MSKNGLLLGEEIAGVNQILPHKHQFALGLTFSKSVANNWSPAEINMSTDDVDQWKNESFI